MKTIISFLFAVAVLASSCNSVLATGHDDTASARRAAMPGKALTTFAHKAFMSTTRPGTLWLITIKAESKPVRVAIQGASGLIINTFHVFPNKLMQSVDCSQLPAGQYKLVLERGNQIENDTFEVK